MLYCRISSKMVEKIACDMPQRNIFHTDFKQTDSDTLKVMFSSNFDSGNLQDVIPSEPLTVIARRISYFYCILNSIFYIPRRNVQEHHIKAMPKVGFTSL